MDVLLHFVQVGVQVGEDTLGVVRARAEAVVYQYPEFVRGVPPAAPIRLSEAYWQRAAPVVDRQLTLGGLRLAALLNATLAR